MKNTGDSVFEGALVGAAGAALIEAFLTQNDFCPNTQRAFRQDLAKFTRWFTTTNREAFRFSRITTADVSGFRDHLRRDLEQSVATVNRALVTV